MTGFDYSFTRKILNKTVKKIRISSKDDISSDLFGSGFSGLGKNQREMVGAVSICNAIGKYLALVFAILAALIVLVDGQRLVLVGQKVVYEARFIEVALPVGGDHLADLFRSIRTQSRVCRSLSSFRIPHISWRLMTSSARTKRVLSAPSRS